MCLCLACVRAGERVGDVWTPPQPPTDGDSVTAHGPRNWVAAPNAATTWQQDGQDDSGRNGGGGAGGDGGGGGGGGGQVAVGLGSALTVLGTVARVQSDEAELHGDDGEFASNFLTLSLCLSRACHGKASQSSRFVTRGRFVPRLSWQSSSRFAVPFPFSLLLCPFLFFSLPFCPHANAEAQPFRRFVSSFRRFVSSFRRFVVHFV